jgi:uncharacterized protein YbjT (DUF2867 family)
MILVTTPTGNTGSMILKFLVEQGQNVRIFVRDPKKIPTSILEKIEVVTGSLLNETEFTNALQGCDTLYFCVPQSNTQEDVNVYYEDFAKVAAKAIKNSGTKRVVYLSGGGKESGLQAGVATALHKAEDIINQSGASVRSLRCPIFFESLLWQVAPLKKMVMFFLPIDGNYKSPQVAAKDIALLAVVLLTDNNWSGIEGVAVHGAADISHKDIAIQLSELVGKPIRFQQVSREDYVNTLLGHHSTEAFANSLTDMFVAIERGLYNSEPRTIESTSATTIKEWMSENLVSKII